MGSTTEFAKVEAVVKAYRKASAEPKRLTETIARLEKELAEAREALAQLDATSIHSTMRRLLESMPEGAMLSDYRTAYSLDAAGMIVEAPICPSWDDSLDTHFRSIGLLAAPESLHLTPPADVETTPDPIDADLLAV
jgi:hypothetical protein